MADDVGRAAAQFGVDYVHALDKASRGKGLQALLSGDAVLAKVVLIALAITGVVVAVGSLAEFVLVGGVALLAVVPASIADGRGGHRLSWYLYGVLLFPVAVGHALMLPALGEAPTGSGDRQLRALVGGAAALFIVLGLGLITSELATSGPAGYDTDVCYELSDQARDASGASDRASLYDAAADCLGRR